MSAIGVLGVLAFVGVIGAFALIHTLKGWIDHQGQMLASFHRESDINLKMFRALNEQLNDHGQALQDVRAELFNQQGTRAGPASECTCNRPE